MELFTYLVVLALSGLLVGALARLALPGPDPMGLLATMMVGIGGSFVGGLIGILVLDGRGVGNIVLSVLCATGIVYLVRRSHGGTFTRPAPRRQLDR